jgi:hypothetical protein
MKIIKRILTVAFVLSAACLSRADDDKPKGKEPLSEAALIKLAKADIEDDVIVALIKSRGIGFTTNEAAMKRLKNAGLSEKVLAVLPIDSAPADDAKSTDAGDRVLGTGKHDQGLIVEVLEAKPTKHEELMIRWRYRNPTDKGVQLLAATPKFGGSTSPPNTARKYLEGIYYTEGSPGADAAHHTVLIEVDLETKKPTGKTLASDLGRAEVVIRPEQQYEVWALFSLPKRRSEKSFTLCLPNVTSISGIRIQKADDGNAPDGTKYLASARHETGLVVEVLEVKRGTDNNVTIRWRYRNTTQKAVQLLVPNPRFQPKVTPPNTIKKFLENTFYIEGKLESSKAYHQYITSSKELGNTGVKVGPGEQFEFWATFPAPSNKGEKSITLCTLGVPPIRNLIIQNQDK